MLPPGRGVVHDQRMHAIFSTVSLDPTRMEEARTILTTIVVPGAKADKGFVAGYWISSPDLTIGRSVEIFESEAAAQAALDGRATPPPGGPVTPVSAEILAVEASA